MRGDECCWSGESLQKVSKVGGEKIKAILIFFFFKLIFTVFPACLNEMFDPGVWGGCLIQTCGWMFDALLMASAGESPWPMFSPGVPVPPPRLELLKAAKLGTVATETFYFIIFFFPTGKTSCPDHPPSPLFGGV